MQEVAVFTAIVITVGDYLCSSFECAAKPASMNLTIQEVTKQVRTGNLREATYILFSIARKKTDDYTTFDEEAEIEFYYSIKRAAKHNPERLKLLFYYLDNVTAFHYYLPKLISFFRTGSIKGISQIHPPCEEGSYNSARA